MTQSDGLPDLYRVRPTSLALRESRVGQLFESHEERCWVVDQLKLLRHWPGSWKAQNEFGLDLSIDKITCQRCEFYEYRIRGKLLSHGGNLRVFFWVHDPSRTIWVAHAYWKKSQRIAEAVKRRVARRIRNLQGQIQDGDIP